MDLNQPFIKYSEEKKKIRYIQNCKKSEYILSFTLHCGCSREHDSEPQNNDSNQRYNSYYRRNPEKDPSDFSDVLTIPSGNERDRQYGTDTESTEEAGNNLLCFGKCPYSTEYESLATFSNSLLSLLTKCCSRADQEKEEKQKFCFHFNYVIKKVNKNCYLF